LIHKLTAGFLAARTSIIFLAIWETIIGLLLILGFKTKEVLILLQLHMVCTFTPLFLFPALSFKIIPYSFTLLGQYIMKNIIIISAAWVLWQSVPAKQYKARFV
jgi:uncharacterized membrane protein YphA (DoxX/SURF4 family)